MRLLATLFAFALSAAPAAAQGYVYEQPMAAGGGVTRPSQLWIDPSGQNDLDSDAIAWEDFELPQDTTITRLRWWGQTAPPLGFEIGFFNLPKSGGGVVRLGIVPTTPAGTALSNTTLSVQEGLVGGELRHYQFWYRNVVGPCGHGFNTTDGLSIQW